MALATLDASAQFPFMPFPDMGSGIGTIHEKTVEFDYDVDFQYYFDNREFSRTDLDIMRSYTIHAVRAVPAIGLRINSDPSVRMRLMAGADFLQNMGERSRCVGDEGRKTGIGFQEPQLYFKIDKLFSRGVFSAAAGIYPAAESEGYYSRAMISDSTRFYDNEMEGVLFKYSSQRFYGELGLDWCGQYGQFRREQFRIFSAGRYDFNRTFSAGWALDAGHFANSEEIKGVMDNIIGNVYVRADIGGIIGIDELSLKGGYLGAYQRNRKLEKKAHFPGGAEIILTASHRNVGIQNTFYAGGDLMPYYSQTFTSASGDSWINGAFLYRGETTYRTGFAGAKCCDCTEFFYQPHVFDFMDIRLAVDLHFVGSKMIGSQQKFSLVIDLDTIRNPKPAFRQVKTGRRTSPHGIFAL